MPKEIKDWINEEHVKYFNLLEFVSKIKLNDTVLYHMQDTGENFEKYLNSLVSFCNSDDYVFLYYLLDLANKELIQSANIENHVFKNMDLLNGDLFFDRLSISHERIKKIHKFICENSGTSAKNVGEYRKDPVNVGANYDTGYQVYWYGPDPSDIKKFMDDYISFYNTKSLNYIYSNPFLKSALAHLLFVRIHPFGYGNGRTARIIQNISFTSSINKIYGTNLKLSPLNISQNIVGNKFTYADRINRVHFDIDYDNEKTINRWFDFILNMYDEQLYFQFNRLPQYEDALRQIERLKNENDEIAQIAKKFKIDKIKSK